jgi:hypothetical protein
MPAPRTNLKPRMFVDQAPEIERLADKACSLRAKLEDAFMWIAWDDT